jgi:alcohol dehydrogenase (cytochrome c)
MSRIPVPCPLAGPFARVAFVSSFLLGHSAAVAADDAAAAGRIFDAQCTVCHSNQPGVNGFGPSLAGVVGRGAAIIRDFKYTSALRNSGVTWTTANLDQFLSVAIKDGKVIRGTGDGYLIALDMANGSLLWSRQIASASNSQYLSMPPLIWNDMVLYGPAGADFGPKNWVGAFRLSDGEPVWRFNLIPDPDEPGAETWKNRDALMHGGGSLWTPLSLDARAGVLYVPVGNPAPDFFGAVRPGDDLYTNSLVALDIRTGKLLWYRQFVSHDEHDSDTSQVSPLFSLKTGPTTRDVVAVSGKDGLLRLIDRTTHDQLYEVPITTRENVDASPTVEGVHRCPGLLGGMEWNGPAYDPNTGRLFVAAVDWCGTFKKFDAPPPFAQESHYYGGSVTPNPHEKSRGWLTAFDAATGKEVWKYASPTPLVAGVTATSGGVLFTGDLDDNFLVLDAASGQVLYRFYTGGSIGGGTVTYERNGKQYVAVASGSVSAFFGGSGLPLVAIFALP